MIITHEITCYLRNPWPEDKVDIPLSLSGHHEIEKLVKQLECMLLGSS